MKVEFLYCKHFHVFDIAMLKNKKHCLIILVFNKPHFKRDLNAINVIKVSTSTIVMKTKDFLNMSGRPSFLPKCDNDKRKLYNSLTLVTRSTQWRAPGAILKPALVTRSTWPAVGPLPRLCNAHLSREFGTCPRAMPIFHASGVLLKSHCNLQ